VSYRVPAFWDGGNTFRARLVATQPGEWSWSTGNATGDNGLDNKSGGFTAIAWTEADKQDNPNRRGFLRVQGRHLEYQDGTPFFMTADTRSTLLTDLFRWNTNTNSPARSGVFFQDLVNYRKDRGFNTFQVISCFPSDLFDQLWQPITHGKKHAEGGSWPFGFLPPDAQGIAHPDFSSINPTYWQQLDRKFRYLSDQGMVLNLEVLRRSEGKILESQTNMNALIRYLWARYGCYNLIWSWMHIDAGMTPAYPEYQQLVQEFIRMLKLSHEALGGMPYGQPKTIMVPWGTCTDVGIATVPNLQLDTALNAAGNRFLDINSFSNLDRLGKCIPFMRQMFLRPSALPVVNVEPYWPTPDAFFPRHTFLTMEQQAQFAMYGCVLNGGSVLGHTWGCGYWTGAVSSTNRISTNMDAYRIASMGKLREFIMDFGHDYRLLTPAPAMLRYDQSSVSSMGGDYELHSLAMAPDRSFGLGFIAATLNSIDITGLPANAVYTLQWWHIDNGGWQGTTVLTTDGSGRLDIPNVPDLASGTPRGWAFRIRAGDRSAARPFSARIERTGAELQLRWPIRDNHVYDRYDYMAWWSPDLTEWHELTAPVTTPLGNQEMLMTVPDTLIRDNQRSFFRISETQLNP
jgi:hypothetical protein